jgi:hypothetical protein
MAKAGLGKNFVRYRTLLFFYFFKQLFSIQLSEIL